ncbi:hypothetical protein Q1695_012443 [Nippostrongylus brasiliensis]|nr:hypothetical protein Q1695_012443 [Nippostrongylus brasiliensis]
MTIPAVRARMVHDSVNELVKKTILGVEDILLHLPQDGERVDVLTNDEQTNVNEIELPVKRNREPLQQVCTSSNPEQWHVCGCSAAETKVTQKRTPVDECLQQVMNQLPTGRLAKAKARILANSVRVFPLRDVDGMMIEMVLQLQKDSSNEAQNIEVIVECPNYKPNRINIGGTCFNLTMSSMQIKTISNTSSKNVESFYSHEWSAQMFHAHTTLPNPC